MYFKKEKPSFLLATMLFHNLFLNVAFKVSCRSCGNYFFKQLITRLFL